MYQDLGQAGLELSLGPAWMSRPHIDSTSNRNWFTIIKYLRADGKGGPRGHGLLCDINIEMGQLSGKCYAAAPGHLLGTTKTGMQEKTEANKQAREERAEAKVVEEHEKQKAHAERLASEAVVRDLLKSCDCWSSKKGYVMVGDMDKFIKTYRNELKKLSKYGAKMSASDKLALLEQATDECDASVFARRSGRRR